jgi:hypothetical protein
MHDNSIRRRILAPFLVVPVLYVLSIGPVAGLSGTDFFNQSLLTTVYWPLREASRVDCIGRLTVAYINVFMNTTEREAGRDWDNRPGIGWGRGIPFDHEMEQMPPPHSSNLQPPSPRLNSRAQSLR